MDQQRTIQREIRLKGQGLHTASEVEVRIQPGEPNTGIVFVRVSDGKRTVFPGTIESVQVGGGRQTSLGTGSVQIRTVEHLMEIGRAHV